MIRFALALLLISVAACGKSEPAAAPAPAAPVAAPKPPAPSTPWTFDAAAVQAKLQGTWVMTNASFLGSKEAWKVEGDKVTVFLNGKEDVMTLTVQSPCTLALNKKNPDGSSEGSVSHYVLDGDVLHLGLGDAGVKTADGVVACMSNGIFVLKGTDCKFYTEMFDKLSSEGATCSFDADGFKGSEKNFNYSGGMAFTGTVFMSDQLKSNAPAMKAKDWEDAKAQVAKK